MVCYIEVEGRGGEKILTAISARAYPLFARTKIRVDYYLTPPCGFSIYFRRRVRNVYTGFALIGQGISHRVMKRRGMSLRFEVISLFHEWSCVSRQPGFTTEIASR